MKLYGHIENFRTQKVLAAAKLSNKQLAVLQAPPPSSVSPFGLIPALEDGNVTLFGAESICKYLLKDQYYPKKYESEIDEWLFWGEGRLLPDILGYVLPSVSAMKIDEDMLKITKDELFAQLALFDQLLSTRTFMVGERLTIADISLAFNLLPAFQYVLGIEARSSFKNLTRYFMTIINQPGVKDAFATEFKLIDKPLSFDESEYEKNIKAKITAKVETKQTKSKGTDKKEEQQEDLDMADAAIAAEPKFQDPLNALPAGKFVMDAFKRVYSNEDTATKAIPYLWENFDPDCYSIWYCEFKYPEDLKQTFMSCNLITGMFQRLDKMRKHAFASMALFGTDNNSTISGIWTWRGQELAFKLCPDWQIDYDTYEWKKLDPKNENDKKMINEYLMWEGAFGGKKFNQGKIFK